jgi:hypothetical protein
MPSTAVRSYDDVMTNPPQHCAPSFLSSSSSFHRRRSDEGLCDRASAVGAFAILAIMCCVAATIFTTTRSIMVRGIRRIFFFCTCNAAAGGSVGASRQPATRSWSSREGAQSCIEPRLAHPLSGDWVGESGGCCCCCPFSVTRSNTNRLPPPPAPAPTARHPYPLQPNRPPPLPT